MTTALRAWLAWAAALPLAALAEPAAAQTQLAPLLPPGSTLPPALPYQAPAYQAPTYQAPYRTPNYQAPGYQAPNYPSPTYPGAGSSGNGASQGYPAPAGPLPSERAPAEPAAPTGETPGQPPASPAGPNAEPGASGASASSGAAPNSGATPPPASGPPASGGPTSVPMSGSWTQARAARLIALDKVSAKATEVTVPVGQSTTFGTLTIAVKACIVRPSDVPADAAAFLQITDSAANQPGFSGWMFHQEPALAMLQSPLYNITVAGCVAQGG